MSGSPSASSATRWPNPTITFTYASGTLSTSARWYMDAVRFEDFCCCPYIPPPLVPGPLAAGQTSVLVTNVVAGASNVIVRANGATIGSTNYAPGFAAGQLTVPTSPLVAGSTIYAQQFKYGCWSAMLAGPVVQALLITKPYTGATALWGRSAALSVAAIGAEPIGYQWFKDGAMLGSATSCTYGLPVVGLSNAGSYSVVVSNEWQRLTNSGQLVVRSADLALHLEPDRCAGLIITGAADYTYQMQATANPGVTNSWITLTNLTLQQPVQVWVDTGVSGATNPCRFYRVLPAP